MYESFPKPTDADIIIIGAGLSGMSAAFYIFQHDPMLNVLVLEARDHIGGRILSFPLRIREGDQLANYDFGGQFVSSSQVHIMDLLQKLDLRLIRLNTKSGKMVLELEKDKIITKSEYNFSFGNFEEMLELSKFCEMIDSMGKKVTFTNPVLIKKHEKLDSETMESFLKRHLQSSVSQNFIRHVIRTSCGIEPSQISVLFYLAFCNATEGIENQFKNDTGSAKEAWIQGGADQICQKIAHIIGSRNIKLNDRVIEIVQEHFHVTIETEKETYHSNYVILAIPPTQVVNIEFYPPLETDRYYLLNSFSTGHFTKFAVTYPKPFWIEKGYSGEIVSCTRANGTGPICSCYDITFKNRAALTGYISSCDCATQTKESYKEQVLQQLAKYFGDEALNPTDYYEKSWMNEPYIRGCCMNSPGLGNMHGFCELRQPLGRLFWAGTETATVWNGYMGGAVQAGYRAAIEVLYDYRPQILTGNDIHFISCRRRPTRSRLKETIEQYKSNSKILLSIAGILIVLYIYRRWSRK